MKQKLKQRIEENPKVEKLKNICWVCNKKQHTLINGLFIMKLTTYNDNHKKKQYLFNRYAPLGCWLAYNKGYIKKFYLERTWFGWKK